MFPKFREVTCQYLQMNDLIEHCRIQQLQNPIN